MSDSNEKKLSTEEHKRLEEARRNDVPWRKWGPYLSERQWGTVREDYSHSGDAWNYFPHDHARSRAYRWGEDGLAGISDDQQTLCFAVALWNEHDPILKERLFGLTNSEGNHGEDVKEYYFYLDSTPTHSYMKWLYKYPQNAYPYDDIVKTNASRSRLDPEYELIDTGVFNDDRYFDVFVEYAKVSPEDVLIRIEAINRGPDPAPLRILPTIWFRNTWVDTPGQARPVLHEVGGATAARVVAASHPMLGSRWLYVQGDAPLLFTENETNTERLFGQPNPAPYVKDALNEFVVFGRRGAVNPDGTGTKAASHVALTVGAGQSAVVRLRLSDESPDNLPDPFADFDRLVGDRQREANDFYQAITPESADADAANVMRQALAGMLWSKQYYAYDITRWLQDRGLDPMTPDRPRLRNDDWSHMANADVISMPDKWEYPWYAAWDLAFHTIALAGVDLDFAKSQLELMLDSRYFHPNGQIPAYEWNFSDVNPPVHAWATLFVNRTEIAKTGKVDVDFLKRSFMKLLANFTWWVNRKDRFGHNVFEGGFLGLDNIGVFDRSAPLPTGGHLEQADGTAWMAFYCQNMLELAIAIGVEDPSFEEMAFKFVSHFLNIANAVNRLGAGGMWDDEDGFYYDVLRAPDGTTTRLKVRSIVGLLPMCATTMIEPWQRERMPGLVKRIQTLVQMRPDVMRGIHPTGTSFNGYGGRDILALVNPDRLRRLLERMLDEREFLSAYGIRALSRAHLETPYLYRHGDDEFKVGYLPAESDTGMFGGNSNWRGPIWMPMNVLLIRALLNFYGCYGNSFQVECPTGSGRMMNLFEVAKEIATRLSRIFLRDERGRRPVYGGTEKFQTDPHWRDHLLFYEYFHGDNGAGIGASHQTGWTGLVGTLIDMFGTLDATEVLEAGKAGVFRRGGYARAKHEAAV